MQTMDRKTVEVELVFRRIGVIDSINEHFQAEITVRSSWIDNNVKDSYSADKNWNPKLFISNIVATASEVIKYIVAKDENDNTVITEKRQIKG